MILSQEITVITRDTALAEKEVILDDHRTKATTSYAHNFPSGAEPSSDVLHSNGYIVS